MKIRLKNNTDMKNYYDARYGKIFEAMRKVQDKSLAEVSDGFYVSENSSTTYFSVVEKGKLIQYDSFVRLCEAYKIEPSKFVEIAELIKNENLSNQEILFLCAEYESLKQPQHSPITDDEIDKKPGMILKAMRVSQDKTLAVIGDEMNISFPYINAIETARRVPSLKQIKKYTKFFQISDEDFDVFYNAAVTQNWSFAQILYYCLILDMGRQKSEDTQLNIKQTE